MPLPPGKTAQYVAESYMSWLPGYLKPFLRVDYHNGKGDYRVRFFNWKLLGLEKDEAISRPHRQLYRITGGLLAAADDKGRFEFRESFNKKFLIAALHNFKPALPWPVYRFTQALLHRVVMHQFGKVMGKIR